MRVIVRASRNLCRMVEARAGCSRREESHALVPLHRGEEGTPVTLMARGGPFSPRLLFSGSFFLASDSGRET